MQKARPSKPSKISNQVLKIPNNLYKRPLELKNPILNRPKKSLNKLQELMPQVKQSQPKSILRKVLMIWVIALRKRQVTRVQLCSRPNKMLAKDWRIRRKALKKPTIMPLKS
jgi:hypothetical protein